MTAEDEELVPAWPAPRRKPPYAGAIEPLEHAERRHYPCSESGDKQRIVKDVREVNHEPRSGCGRRRPWRSITRCIKLARPTALDASRILVWTSSFMRAPIDRADN